MEPPGIPGRFNTIFEMNAPSYRRRTAMEHKQHGRPANYAAPKNVGMLSLRDNQPAT
jgi:hypothetical protein